MSVTGSWCLIRRRSNQEYDHWFQVRQSPRRNCSLFLHYSKSFLAVLFVKSFADLGAPDPRLSSPLPASSTFISCHGIQHLATFSIPDGKDNWRTAIFTRLSCSVFQVLSLRPFCHHTSLAGFLGRDTACDWTRRLLICSPKSKRACTGRQCLGKDSETA